MAIARETLVGFLISTEKLNDNRSYGALCFEMNFDGLVSGFAFSWWLAWPSLVVRDCDEDLYLN